MGSISMYINGPHYGGSVHAVAEVLYAETVPRGSDPFGELKCGLLEIRCFAITTQVMVHGDYSAYVSILTTLSPHYRYANLQ